MPQDVVLPASKPSYAKKLLYRLSGQKPQILRKTPWWARPFRPRQVTVTAESIPRYERPALRKLTLEQARLRALGDSMIGSGPDVGLIQLLFPERARPDESDAA